MLSLMMGAIMKTFVWNISAMLLLILFVSVGYGQYRGGNGAGFAVAVSQNDISLPVTLQNFAASAVEDTVVIRWKTASELENAGYLIYRAFQQSRVLIADFHRFTQLSGAGNSNEVHEYEFTDSSSKLPGIYTYEIYCEQINGTRELVFKIDIRIHHTAKNPFPGEPFIAEPVYPNPFNGITVLPVTILAEGNYTIEVYNISGQRVHTVYQGFMSAGVKNIVISLSDFPTGIYFVKMQNEKTIRVEKISYIR